MKTLRFFGTYCSLTMGKFCQQRWLLAGLILLCALVPRAAGQAAGTLLSRGVDFSGVTLAICAPQGDRTPALLEQYMGGMEEISQYCTVLAMEEETALDALEAGDITAVLVLPEDFIQGVMGGRNPDLRLIVAGDQPLESLLLLWVGQSASDILAAFQSGVYAVLDLYGQSPPAGLTRDQVVIDINLEYISLALGREELFQTHQISATGSLPVSVHYTLALLAYFALSSAPLFVPLYSGGWLCLIRRLRSAGRSCVPGYLSAVAAGGLALLLLLAPALLLAGEGAVAPVLAAAAGMALFCSLFCSLCCLAAGNAVGCGVLAFLVSLSALALAGGILPPVLLPGPLRQLAWLSPVTWLMELAAWSLGCAPAPDGQTLAALGISAAGMALLGLYLLRRRADRQEVAP